MTYLLIIRVVLIILQPSKRAPTAAANFLQSFPVPDVAEKSG